MARLAQLTVRRGHRFDYQARGRTGAPTLIIHPGGPGLTAEYLRNLLALGDRTRRVVLFHPRGVGRSYAPRLPRQYTLPALADDVDAIRASLGLDVIDLLGFSAGGFVAIEYARKYPHRLRSLLLCGTAASASDLRTANRKMLRGITRDQRRQLRKLERRNAFRTPEYQQLIEAIERPYQTRFLKRPSPDLAASRLNPVVYRAMMTRTGDEFVVDGTLARWDRRAALARIRVPTLVLVGRHDFLYPACREIARRTPGARLVVLDRASHLANLERPGAYRKAIDRFLRSVPGTPRRALSPPSPRVPQRGPRRGRPPGRTPIGGTGSRRRSS